MTRGATWGGVLAAAVVAVPVVASAQATTGIVTGRVTDRSSGQPLIAAQVQVVGTSRGSATTEDGSFRIAGVPAGTYQVRVLRIGYQSVVQQVTVAAGQTATVNFTLGTAAVNLDQVVVTGTGETQRRRESGASTASIDTSRLNLSAVTNFSQVLSARTPGLTVTQSGGTSGTGSRIRIRGSNSLSLSNDPLLIVDGVLLNNNTNGLTLGVGGQTTSRFDDINPEDIESFEVIRGPAATALFGTAAANGVIQITTKKGRAGKTRYNVYAEGQTNRDVINYPANFAQIGRTTAATPARTVNCNIDQQARGLCTPFADSLVSHNPVETVSPFRTGNRQTYGVNASGGATGATYFLAAEGEREQGIYEPNKINRLNLRSNLNGQLSSSLLAQVNIAYTRGATRLPFNDNSAFGLLSQGLLGRAFDCNPQSYRGIPSCGTDSLSRGYFTANITPQDFFIDVRQQDVSRFVGGGTMNYTPNKWLKGVLRGGIDLLNRYDQTLTPPNQLNYSQATLEGSRFQGRAEIPTYSGNGTLSATFNPRPNLQTVTSIGAQYLNEITRVTTASGAILLPGTASLNGTSARFAVNETNAQVKTIGGYIEQRVSYADRLFLGLALRGDDNSAFGRDFPLVYYPAANVSYVAREGGDLLGQLRFRAAYGQSGQRPGFRQAQTFFSPVSVRVEGAELPAVTIGGTGNSELKPEISAEIEGGVDVSLLQNRVSLEVTGYSRSTRDLLVSRVLAPSLGATNNQFVNLAGMRNVGFEAQINATPFELRRLKYETNLSITLNRNRLTGLGAGIQPIIFSFNSVQQHRTGFPAGGYFQRTYSFADLNSDGLISRVNCPSYAGVSSPQVVGGPRCEVTLSDSVEYLGTPLPTRELNFNQSLSFMNGRARLNALVNYRGGMKLFNSTREFRCSTTSTCVELQDRNQPLADQAKAIARLMGTNAGYIEKADFVRLAEVALSLSLPQRIARLGRLQDATLTLAGRNLGLWTDYTGFDPEVNSVGTAASGFTTADFLAQPPTRFFSARLSFNF